MTNLLLPKQFILPFQVQLRLCFGRHGDDGTVGHSAVVAKGRNLDIGVMAIKLQVIDVGVVVART